MRKLRKLFKWAVGLLVVAVAAWVLVVYVSMRGSLPQLDGQIKLAGLSGPVTIVRDENAVPHITAGSMNDAYFAVGFLQAQDRFWQMHMNRRIGAGRISELIGAPGLGTDRFLRTLGVYRKAQKAFETLDEKTKSGLEAYAAGVNAWLESQSGFVTPEFAVLMLGKPEKWQPADSLVWLKMMSWDLGGNWRDEIGRLELAAHLPMKFVQQYYPPYPGDKPIDLPDLAQLYGLKLGKTAGVLKDDSYPEVLRNSGVVGVGSNNWVVNGSRTKSGKPMLANDPHLGLTAPAIWYHVHISVPSENYDAIGATLPAAPYIILGRNQRIAWGFTNTGPDVQDMYVERLSAGKKGYYDTPTGPAKFKTREETIKVRFGDDVKITVRETRHGPVMSDVLKKLPKILGDKAVLAFQWTALLDEDSSARAAQDLSKATNWQEFKAAASWFVSPQQNMVYADTAGNIGYYAPSKIPVRKPENKTKGLAPAPGWDAAYDWDGFLDYSKLPQKYNPENGVIYTANHKVVDDDYPYYITSSWTLPYRADRIKAMLAATPKHDAASFMKMHSDVQSLFVLDLLPTMLSFIKDEKDQKEIYDLMKAWDGRSLPNRPEMLIFAYWYDGVMRGILDDDAGFFDRDSKGKKTPNPRHRIKATLIKNVLTNKDGESAWCGKVDKVSGPVDCGPLVVKALNEALVKIEAKQGSDIAKWQWGREHVAVSEHRPLGKFPLLNKLFNVTVPTGGGPYTVNVSNYKRARMGYEFPNIHAASLRHIFDLSDLNKSKFIYQTGQSGHVLSKYYSNFSKRWAAVKYLPLTTDKAAYEKGAIGTLELIPGGS